jgi:hypothetical protein
MSTTLLTSIIPTAAAATTTATESLVANPGRNKDGSPIVTLTVANYITVLGVVLFGIGLGLVIWWYYGKKRVDARNKAKGVA